VGLAASGPTLLIANPRAGRGRGDVLDRLQNALRARGMTFETALTAGPGDATDIARRAVEDAGARFVIAVGGDGTVHEVVNGLVDADSGRLRGDDPVLGVVSSGSGCDLVRTFGLDRAPEVVAGHLVTEDTMRIDLGRVRYRDAHGRTQVRVFANIAEVGFGGEVARTAARLPAALGTSRYTVGIVLTWGRFRRVPTRIRHDGGLHEAAVCNIIVANGQFFGGGLHVAPRALPTNGRLNLQSWVGTPTDVLRASRQLRDGSHLARADVSEWQTSRVSIDSDRPLAVEADGEVLGLGPAEFDVLPGILRFKV